MRTIKLKKYKGVAGSEYDINQYEEAGFFVTPAGIYFANKNTNLTCFVCMEHELPEESKPEESKPEESNKINERFALEMLAVALGKKEV